MTRRAWLIVGALTLCATAAAGEGVLFPDGRFYPGDVRASKASVRVVGAERIVVLPASASAHVGSRSLNGAALRQLRRARAAFARESYEEVIAALRGTSLDPALLARAGEARGACASGRERLRQLADAAGLAGLGEVAQAANALRTRFDARSAASVAAVVTALGPLPGAPAAIRAQVDRLRLAVTYGASLDAPAVLALDPAAIAAAEAFLRKLLIATPNEQTRLLSQPLPPLSLALWTTLIRGGAGRVEAPRPRQPETRRVKVSGGEITYDLHVPRSYRAGASAPLLVALHGEGQRPASMIASWRPVAERFGWLLASAEFVVHGKRGYRHSWPEQQATLATIQDVASRFAVDPDRVFVTGHSLGGHATYDVALSHPDRFAGAAPIVGGSFAFAQHYRQNAVHVPIYCVEGETDVWAARNRKHVPEMLKAGADVTHVEYVGRGHSGFFEEYEAIATWAEGRRRDPYPRRLSLRAGRTTDLRRFWIRIDDVSATFFPQAPTEKVSKKAVTHLAARIRRRNRIKIDAKGVRSLTVFLNGSLVDLEKKVRIRLNGRVRFNALVQPSVNHLLADFLQRRDRGMLFSASVTVSAR